MTRVPKTETGNSIKSDRLRGRRATVGVAPALVSVAIVTRGA